MSDIYIYDGRFYIDIICFDEKSQDTQKISVIEKGDVVIDLKHQEMVADRSFWSVCNLTKGAKGLVHPLHLGRITNSSVGI